MNGTRHGLPRSTRFAAKLAWPTLLALVVASCATTSPTVVQEQPAKSVAPPSVEQMTAAADQHYRRGDFQAALHQYVAALQIEPDSAGLLFRIGSANAELGNSAVAATAFEQALELAPGHPAASEGLGLIYLELRRYDEAREHLVRALSGDANRSRARRALGILADLEQDHVTAKSNFLAAGAGANPAVTYNNIGFSRYLAGDWEAAEDAFETALQHDPRFERARNNLGLLLTRQGKYARAFDAFTQTLTAAEAYNNIGYFSMLAGRHDEASRYLQRALDASPRFYPRAQENLLRNAAMASGKIRAMPDVAKSFATDEPRQIETPENIVAIAPSYVAEASSTNEHASIKAFQPRADDAGRASSGDSITIPMADSADNTAAYIIDNTTADIVDNSALQIVDNTAVQIVDDTAGHTVDNAAADIVDDTGNPFIQRIKLLHESEQEKVAAPRVPAKPVFPVDAERRLVATDVLRVRRHANPDSPSIAAVMRDQEVAIVDRRDEWVLISYLSSQSQRMRRGWVHGDFLAVPDVQADKNDQEGNSRAGDSESMPAPMISI